MLGSATPPLIKLSWRDNLGPDLARFRISLVGVYERAILNQRKDSSQETLLLKISSIWTVRWGISGADPGFFD